MEKQRRFLKVRVVSIPGAKAAVTKEGTQSRYHTEADGVFEVPASAYYYRAIHRQELELAAQPKRKKDNS